MTDCPPNQNDQLGAENERLKSQLTGLVNAVAEARDKTDLQGRSEPDPNMIAILAAMSAAYESVLAKAEALAHPPDTATTAGGAVGYGGPPDEFVGPEPTDAS